MKECHENQVDENKSLPVLVDYEPAAQYLADEGRNIFTGRMNGGLWNARCMDACIISKKQGDKAAYELGKNLGMYLFLIASQGSGEAKMGFYGPLPFEDTPNHDLIAFSFMARDPSVLDPRAQKSGVQTFFAIFG